MDEKKAPVGDDEMEEDVEYVTEQLEVPEFALEAFSDVFARFQAPTEETSVRERFWIAESLL